MSMLQVTTIGRLTADVELKTGNNSKFVGFNLAVNTGFGEKAKTEYLQCILFDAAAERFIKAGVKKGSLIWIVGELSLKAFKRKSGGEDKCLNVQVGDWGYVPSGNSKEKTDGDAKENKPEREFTHFEETSIGDDEDLPF